MTTDTLTDKERIARALGYDGFDAAPETVQRTIAASAPDGVTVVEDGTGFEHLAERAARIAEEARQ